MRLLRLILSLGACCAAWMARATDTQYYFTTLAGTAGVRGSADGAGGAAQFSGPNSVAVDGAGNVFVADNLNLTLRKITPSGSVTTIAGSPGVGGNVNGIALAARFGNIVNIPLPSSIGIQGITGLAFDAAGNLYVGDYGNSDVRLLSVAGTVSTYAGRPSSPILGGNVGDGVSTTATFSFINGIACDAAGTVYVSDAYCVRKITSGLVVSTLAGVASVPGSLDGTGNQARFGYAAALSVDRTGNVFVADSGNGTIRMISPNGTVTSVAGSSGSYGSADGIGTDARFGKTITLGSGGNVVPFPFNLGGMVIDQNGNLLVSDSLNNTIRKITPTFAVTTVGGLASDVAGDAGGLGSSARFKNPQGLAVDSAGNLYVADSGNNTIRKGEPAVAPVIQAQPLAQTLALGQSLTLSVAASGVPKPTIQWTKDGNSITGATSMTYTVSSMEVSDAGSYLAVATNLLGTVSSTPAIIQVGNAPVLTAQPLAQAVAIGRPTTLSIGATGAVSYQWQKNGAAIPGATNFTLMFSNVQPADAGNYTVVVTNAIGSVTSSAAAIAVGAIPAVVTQPQPQTQAVEIGKNATLTVTATGATTYQWQKDGTAIAGATGATLTLSGVQASDAGRYTVTVTNAFGTATSNAATLSVGTAPVVATQPQAPALLGGQSAMLSVSATGAVSYQWQKDGTAISGATNATLTLSQAQAGDAGSYSVVITNPFGSVTSAKAAVSVNTSRIVNLSIRTNLPTGGLLSVGFVVSGNGKPVLVRGIGPALGQFGVTGVMADPRLGFYSGGTQLTSNDNWGQAANFAQVVQTAAQVGAFALTPGGLDAALLTTLDGGSYSAQLSGVNGAGGIVLVELYDANTATAARLINVSALTQVGVGDGALLAGFVVSGNAKKTLLIRAIGPTLTTFGVDGALADPRLDVLASGASAALVSNDNWGGGADLSAAFATVGAFSLAGSSKDAALLVTLDPGAYTAQVSGVGGTTGVALVEVYELP